MPTEVFTIRPLGWEWFENGHTKGWKHKSKLFTAWVWQDFGIIKRQWGPWFISSTGCPRRVCASPEEGKRLAEEHWQSYIKQALVLVEGNDAD